MPIGAARSGLLLPQGAPPPLLVAPTSLSTVSEGGTGGFITSGTISPPAGALVAVLLHSRGSGQAASQVTGMSSSGLTWAGSWRIVQLTPAQLNTATDRYVGGVIALRQVVSGSGTVTATYAGDTFQRVMNLLSIATGFDTDIASFPAVTNGGEATSLALNFASAPAASSLILTTLGEHAQVGGSFTVPSGHTALDRVQASTNLDSKGSFRLTGGAQNNTWTGLDSGEADAGVAVEILQA